MKFGLFYELQLPKPGDRDQWDPDAERRIYHEMLDQVALADSLGFDYVFEVEHHFLEEYSHACASGYMRFLELHPEVKAETIPMRDRRIPRIMRWPALGANMDLASVQAGTPKIDFVREAFSVSEAMTYYQFALDEILEREPRSHTWSRASSP